MEEKNIQLRYVSLQNDELQEDEKELIEKAKSACDTSYAPYSKFNVGCAVLLENGIIITGNNQENVSYPAGTCAERTALNYARAQHPNLKILKIAIAAKQGNRFTTKAITPCGICRQVMVEIEDAQQLPIQILLFGTTEIAYIPSACTLLPLKFNL